MAPRPFEVRLMLGRFVSREIVARDEQTAEDIARYLYSTFGDRCFEGEPEDIIDVMIDDPGEGAAS